MSTVILGGGLGGLSAAYYSIKKGINPITLYEASNRLGGWVKTEQHDNFLFESGPRTIRPKGPLGRNTIELIEELGLTKSVRPIMSNHVAARNRMLYANGELCMLPNNLGGIFKTIPPFSKPLFTAALNDLWTGASKETLTDESMYSFVERRFGKEIATYAISSMLCGICAGDAKEISVKFLMKEIFRKEQQYGGVIKGMVMDKMFNKKTNKTVQTNDEIKGLFKRVQDENWNIYTLEGGLQLLPETLEKYIVDNDCKLKTKSSIKRIQFNGEKHFSIETNACNTEYNGSLISSVPSYALGNMITHQHPELATELNSIPYVNVGVVNLQYNRDDLIKTPGFGLLVPPVEKIPILGIIFDSCCFDMHGNTVLTVMMGGKWFEEYFGRNSTPEHLLDVAVTNVNKILEIDCPPDRAKINVLKKCIPQYVVGHHERVERIRKYIETAKLPLKLCGAAYDGVGVNDVIFSSKIAVA